MSCPESYFQPQDKVAIIELTTKLHVAEAVLRKEEEANARLMKENDRLMKENDRLMEGNTRLLKHLVDALTGSELKFDRNI